ncbi:hypothetical protein, partial [Cronobacter sakazakii]|uniref:hypothetical protein n=1 Tax=Cronobacter sakazakii TaxID=28141 RepID=UPI00294B667A
PYRCITFVRLCLPALRNKPSPLHHCRLFSVHLHALGYYRFTADNTSGNSVAPGKHGQLPQTFLGHSYEYSKNQI